MAENKTKPTSKNVASYLAEIEDPLLDLETIAINMKVEGKGTGFWLVFPLAN